MDHRVSYKVYYEDTDALGVVYYANYMKYLERGRTEFFGTLGPDVRSWNDAGYYFVVYKATLTFRKAAELGDIVVVVTRFELPSPYRGVFHQRLERERDGALIVDADVEVVCVDKARNVQEYPDLLKQRFKPA